MTQQPEVIASWSEWTEYGECSQSCGDGIQKRTRTCMKLGKPATNPRECQGVEIDVKHCYVQDCGKQMHWMDSKPTQIN